MTRESAGSGVDVDVVVVNYNAGDHLLRCVDSIFRAAGVLSLDVWVVDGSRVRNHIYDEFLEGGNDQRYRFVPPGEVWVDGATSVEEFEYVLGTFPLVAREEREAALKAYATEAWR